MDLSAYEYFRWADSPERPATSYAEVHALVPEHRKTLQQALLSRYPHGVEPVDIATFFDHRPWQETMLIVRTAEVLALSGFCSGHCPECGLSAKPYSQRNRKIFDPEKLIAFMEKFGIGNSINPLLLYDATDPLDYPYLFDILEYLERFSDLREIKVPT
ncbi:hypothetical protein HZA43_00460 [Candidatus Peregrinibacteria bacterium]|nr:hypothetical protein [Candidatus Peregrinibacteria bacterium]